MNKKHSILFLSLAGYFTIILAACLFVLVRECQEGDCTLFLGSPPRLEWETLLTGFLAVGAAVFIYNGQEKNRQYLIDLNWKSKGEEVYGKLALAELALAMCHKSYAERDHVDFGERLFSVRQQLQPLLGFNDETLSHFEVSIIYIQVKLRSGALINLIDSHIGYEKFDITKPLHKNFWDIFRPLSNLVETETGVMQQKMQKRLAQHQKGVALFENK